ncbi:hypothetical protein, partial [Phaeobacter gallaeciensis]|uniref:hypothetical protein n=1 Tax=Phaeobacter gallaeciensis TaxID=60890 RepID=UPI00237F8322
KQTAQSKLAYFYAALMDQFCAALDIATDMTAGRGHGKLSPEDMAAAIIAGVAQGATLVAPGKSRLVMRLNRFLPGLVARFLAKE